MSECILQLMKLFFFKAAVMQKCKDGPAKKTLYSVLESFQSCG